MIDHINNDAPWGKEFAYNMFGGGCEIETKAACEEKEECEWTVVIGDGPWEGSEPEDECMVHLN